MIEPCMILKTVLSNKPRIDNPVKVLPDPDSPTIPYVLPFSKTILMLSKSI